MYVAERLELKGQGGPGAQGPGGTIVPNFFFRNISYSFSWSTKLPPPLGLKSAKTQLKKEE